MEPQQIALMSVAVVVFVVYRQMMTRPTERRGILYFSGLMILAGLSGGGLVDTRHLALGALMLIAELAFAVGFGMLRASTVRVWRDPAGTAWSKGTGWTLVAWLASLASRIALFGAGYALGLASAPMTVLLFVGVTIAVQSLLVTRRGRALPGIAVRSSAEAPITS